MNKFHTVIVGAGPAGLSCATMLANAGLKVLVLERRKQVGPKICAGGITWSGSKQRLPDSLIQRVFPDQHIFTPWQKSKISANQPLVSTISREALGQWQLEQARSAGALVMTGTQANILGHDRLEADGETISFQYLVGADGSSSTVRRHLGLPILETGVGINCFVPGHFRHMEWHLEPDYFKNGYAWIFPHRDCASIGAYASRRYTSPLKLQKNFRLWADKHVINLGAAKMTAALINYDFQGWRFNNCFLVGDAAGLASPLTGEGIYPAIISAEETARIILNPAYKAPHLKKLLARHRQHHRLVAMTGYSRPVCRLTMEILVMSLRTGLVPFTALEMAG